jgi:hypothetical protein
MSYSYSDNFARILAKENLIIRKSPRAKTASFNMKTRLLIIPDWNGISEELHDMLLVHEVGHAIDTPLDGLLYGINRLKKKYHTDGVKDYINVVEDARIDRKQKVRYPGTISDYAFGYKELYSKDFFGILGSRMNINERPFIDRVNLYFKNGHHLGLKFSPAEQVLIDAVAGTDTFEDVLEVTDSILRYVRITESLDQNTTKSLDETASGLGAGDEDTTFEIENEDAGDEDAGDEDVGDEDVCDLDVLNEAMKRIEKSNKNDLSDQNIPSSSTYRNMQERIDRTLSTESDEYTIVNIGITDPSGVLVPFKKLLKKIPIDSGFSKWRDEEKPNVSYMVSEFERKKAADLNKRVRVDKTGVLNMTSVHQYKYSDDLFKRSDIIPEGKNHGLVFLLDWSGSMNGVIHNTMRQLLTLTMFCRMTNIPFDVYIFQSNQTFSANKRPTNGMVVDDIATPMSHSGFALKNILSSRMNASEYLTMSSFFFSMTSAGSYGNNWNMGGTPLIAALDALPSVMEDFIKMHKVQVPTLFVLTDGDSDIPSFGLYGRGIYSKITMNNPKTKKSYLTGASSSGLVGALIENIKDQCGCRAIGIHLTDNAKMKYGVDFGPNGYVVTNERGYDTHYAVMTTSMNMTSRDNFWKKFGKDMSGDELGDALTKYGKSKNASRILLKSFIDDISLDRTK